MNLLGSPGRALGSIVVFMLVVVALATAAFMGAGWSFADASYMVLLTVYTVGYGEVHPIDTPYLHAVTVGLMVLGCTGMILLTGALVQFLTITQLQNILGGRRVKAEIDRLENHVIVVGFGRIGLMLAKELSAGAARFVVLEQSEHSACILSVRPQFLSRLFFCFLSQKVAISKKQDCKTKRNLLCV